MDQRQINYRWQPTPIQCKRQMTETLPGHRWRRLQFYRCLEVQFRGPLGLGEVVIELVSLPVILIRKGRIPSRHSHDCGAHARDNRERRQADYEIESWIELCVAHGDYLAGAMKRALAAACSE